jgi:signal transduction histidine kinase
MNIRRLSVRARMTLSNIAVVAVVIVLIGITLRGLLARNLQTAMDANLVTLAGHQIGFWGVVPWASRGLDDLARHPLFPPDPKGKRKTAPSPPKPATREYHPTPETPIVETTYGLSGYMNTPVPGGGHPIDTQGFVLSAAGTQHIATVKAGRDELRVYSAPLRDHNHKLIGVVQISESTASIRAALTGMDHALLALLPIALITAGAFGMYQTGRMMQPLRKFVDTAQQVTADDLSRRLPVEGADEFSSLASTTNQMLERLETAFEQQKRFTADASHELRTPLTVVLSASSRLKSSPELPADCQKAVDRIYRSGCVMERLIKDLLLLARSDSGQLELQTSNISLGAVICEAIASAEAAEGPPILNEIDSANVIITGDERHLHRLFANLLSNAIKYTDKEGAITVRCAISGSFAEVSVADTGTGIAEEHLPRLTERFYRVDSSRTRGPNEGGSGLGLAICEGIVQAHKGSMHITSRPGTGTTVTVTLPLAEPVASQTVPHK